MVDQSKNLFSASKFSAMEEELEADVCHEVDAYPSTFGPAIAVEARNVAASFAGTLFEGFTYEVG